MFSVADPMSFRQHQAMPFRLGRGRPVLLTVGAHVRVIRDPQFGPGPWPAEPTGRIVASPAGELFTEVETRQGPERTWWIEFDEPQRDADGDGPYRESQVMERYLRPL